VRIDGYRLEYRWMGPAAGNRPTLVFLHEGLGSVSLWRDFPDAVCERTGCGGLVYSRAGHGTSDPRLEPRSPCFMHDEALVVLPQVLKASEIDDPILIGHSDGASIAIIGTGTGAVAPRGLILEAPHVFVEDLTVDSIRRTAGRYRTTDLRQRLARHHGTGVDALFDDWTRVWLSPEFRSWNIESCLPGVNRPTLVIQGEDDEYGSRAQVEAIARALGENCEVAMLPDCRHTPHADQRASVEDAMVTFIARLIPGARVG
jgi:pimeloyl-ACP methyl ester carboxylesterase